MFDKKGNPIILEYKGGRSELLGDQMKKLWICRKIRELQGRNDPMAAILEQAMQNGKLTGRVYRTPVDEVGNEGTTFQEGKTRKYRGKCPWRRLRAETRDQSGAGCGTGDARRGPGSRPPYTQGRDLHTLTAQNLTGHKNFSKDERKLAKAVNFGLLYGMGAKGLQSYALRSYGIEMSLEEATLYRKRFFKTYRGLKRWHDNERRAWLRGVRETRTLTGRRRMSVQKLTDRLNAPVQGTAADGLKLALALLWERRGECPKAMSILVCHDEVVVECETARATYVESWLKKAMIEGMDAVLNGTDEVVDVPVGVEARTTTS